MKEIDEIVGTYYKMKVIYDDGTYIIKNIKKVSSRNEAIQIAIKFTKEALKKDNAFDLFKSFENDFRQYRNYEIESYLEELTSDYYRISETCPFNDYSYFDNLLKSKQ